jgi:hypothetical protein
MLKILSKPVYPSSFLLLPQSNYGFFGALVIILYLLFRAADRCQLEKRKTINGEDIIWAMEALGFDQYSQLMKIYIHRFKEVIILC